MFFIWLLFPLLAFAVPWPPLREPIDPFLSGDTFRAHCDYAYDEISDSLDPSTLAPKSTLFVSGDLLKDFFRKIHPRILFPYILIVHNTDHPIPGPYRHYLNDRKIIAWFTQNTDGPPHKKLHPLPIGLENRRWNLMNRELLSEIGAKKLPKVHLLYCNFNSATFPSERSIVFSLFAHVPFCYCCPVKKSYAEFIDDLARSKFVLCPRGNGLDTHRFWEALYAGAYPIIKTSSLDPLFEGLPVVIVKEWDEVTEEFLHRTYQEFSEKIFSWNKLTINFWLEWIASYKL